jgi:hypothetical protein
MRKFLGDPILAKEIKSKGPFKMFDRFARSTGFAFEKTKAVLVWRVHVCTENPYSCSSDVFVSRVSKDLRSFSRFEQLERLEHFEQFSPPIDLINSFNQGLRSRGACSVTDKPS